MILLSLLQQFEDVGLGTIDVDLFYEDAPLDSNGNAKDGMWIVSRGPQVSHTNTNVQAFDIYSRHKNKLTGAANLYQVLDYLQEAYSGVCTLPSSPPYTTDTYSNVIITPTSGVESVGVDENGKVVRVISGEIRFN